MAGAAGAAQAQASPTDKATAEALFDDAKRLMEAGRHAEACPKLADSQRLDPGIGTLLYLADCQEKTGRTASAWATFREAAAAARAAGQTDRERIARERAGALEPRLARIVVRVGSPVQGLEVRRDATAMPPSSWGSPMPVDPGDHEIEASAAGRKTWSSRLKAAEAQTVEVTVPALERDPTATSATTLTATATTTPAGDREPPSRQRTAALVAGGAGIVGVGVGTYFGLSAKRAYDDSGSECRPGNVCTARGVDLRDTAFSRATLSTVAFAAGGIGLAAGAVLWLTDSRAERGARVGLPPSAGAGDTGFAVGGTW